MKKILSKNGFISIEAILSTILALMVVLVSIGFFTTIYPRIVLQLETRNLAQIAKIQGGLTDISSEPEGSDIEVFKDKLAKFGYDRNKIEVQAFTNPGNKNAMGITPLEKNGNNYIKRGSGETIYIKIKVPANTSIKAPLSYFKAQSSAVEEYKVLETVMSERW